ncbi:hypothetical protein OG455_07725 [Kitasatospora sp. NBC_01287]|uniref:hypothetical protein n=1 Tax=Kitasatospora sp. NBC_01287 TaxID=2903573 RepID=UPI00225739B6|nr:hypothetical protein [Kitasatospora sp. NBC_01287]MCX4745409.1 hypothetical protein [Kitasatospora sp. NBC_01287]
MGGQPQLPADSPYCEPEADEQSSDPEFPSGPGALEPAAESDTMRRLREGMARHRHRI